MKMDNRMPAIAENIKQMKNKNGGVEKIIPLK